MSPREMRVDFTNYGSFWAIAWHNGAAVEECVNTREKIRPVKTDQEVDIHCQLNGEIGRRTIVVAVFSAFTLEAFINHYASQKLSNSYFKKYLDKLGVKEKWVVIPRIVTGKEINRDGLAFEKIEKLIKLRHRLAHDKPRQNKLNEKGELVSLDGKTLVDPWLFEKHARDSLDTVKLMVKELAEIDESVDIKWLDEAPLNPYE